MASDGEEARAESAKNEDARETSADSADGNDTSAKASERRFRVPPWVWLALLLVVHAAFLLANFAPAITTPDANGYWAQGSLLFSEGQTWFKPETEPQYVGMHWLVTDDGRYFSRYPPGLPLLVGMVYKLFGYRAAVLVNPFLATLTLLGFYFLMRAYLSSGWALCGVFFLAANPMFNQHALACDSHMAVTFLLVWGCTFLARWAHRYRMRSVFLAGLFLGAIPTVRYPEALYALGVGAFLLLYWRRPHVWQHYLVAVAGALIPLTPLLIRNQLAFGAFWRTAYSLTNEQTGFGWEYFSTHAVDYLQNLHGEGVGLLFPVGLIGIVTMCGIRRYRPTGWLFALITLPVTLLYMAYYWAPRGMAAGTMRFLLPTFPCYILAGLWVVALFTARLSRGSRAAVVTALLLCQFVWGGIASRDQLRRLHYPKNALARITSELENQVPEGAVVLAHKQVLQHLDFVRKWRLADPTVVRDRRGRFGAGPGMRKRDADAPAPMQTKKHEMRAEMYDGLRPFGRERAVAWDIREWAGDSTVYYVGSAEQIQQMRGFYFNPEHFKIIKRIRLPELPETKERRSGFRPGPPGGAPAETNRNRSPVRDRQRPRQRGGPGGPGMRRWGFLSGESEIVIAEWTWKPPTSR